MRGKTTTKFRRKRICALLTLLIMIANMFSPYSVLMKTVEAAEPGPGEPYFKLSMPVIDTSPENPDDWDEATTYYYYDYDPDSETPETYEGQRIVLMTLTVHGNSTVIGGDIFFTYDSTKLTPVQETNVGTKKKPVYEMQDATSFENNESLPSMDFGTHEWGTPIMANLDTSASTVRVAGTIKAIALGGSYMTDGDIVATFMFRLADGLKIEDITKEAITLKPASGLDQGLQITWEDSGVKNVDGEVYLKYEGFAGPNKSVNGLSIETPMDKTKYYVGENLDLTGLSVRVLYDDGTSEVITDIAGKFQMDTTKAKETKKLILTLSGETLEVPYNIVTGMEIANNPTKMTYNHDDALDFTSGIINLIYDNGDKVPLNINDGITQGILTKDKTKADTKDPKVTFTYIDNKTTVDLNITVEDPIDRIVITKNPDKLEYDHNQSIDVTGGTIKAVKRSGAEITGISMKDPQVTYQGTIADINSCTNKWQNGELQAGNQKITVTYQGKTADFEIVVNDTIQGIAVKTQPTAKNKYGTEKGSIQTTGAELEVTSGSGNKFTIPITLGMVNTNGYNPNTLDMQNLPVTYAGQTTTAGAGIEIALLDYIESIEVTAPNNLKMDYDTELDLTNVTYVKKYKTGKTSTALPVTQDMISGYNKKPAGSTFNAMHESPQTVTVTLSTPEDGDIDNVPTSDIFIVKVKDAVTGMTIDQRPNKVTYNYGEAFTEAGGRVKLTYASGITANSSISMTDSRITITEIDDSPINMSPAKETFNNGSMNKQLKVTYSDGTATYSANIQITINDILENIKIGTEPTKDFKHGDTFDVENGTFIATYKSGAERTISLANADFEETASGTEIDMTPEYAEYTDNRLTKNVTATYTEKGVSKSLSYDINILNDLRSIKVTSQTHKTEYDIGESLDVTNLEITITRGTGPAEVKSVTADMVSALDTSAPNANIPLTVTYEENGITKTTTYNVSVANSIAGITITAPSKDKYNHGENINTAGATVTLTYADTTTINGDLSKLKFYEADGTTPLSMSPASYDTSNKLTKPVVISYTEGTKTETINWNITIINDIQGITVVSTDHKTVYNVNDSLDTNKLKISVTRAVGTPSIVDVTNDMVSGFGSSEETTNLPLTITYTENEVTQTTTYNITVVDSIIGIRVKTPPRVDQKYNTEIDITGGKLEVISGKGTKEIAITKEMLSTYNMEELGDQTVTVTYAGFTDTFPIKVKDYVDHITINPPEAEGTVKEALQDIIDRLNVTYTVHYAKAGDKDAVTLLASMLKETTPYDPNSTTVQNLTFVYKDNDENSYSHEDDIEKDFKVTLSNKIVGITIKAPNKDKYNHGENIDKTGATVTLTYADNTTEDGDISKLKFYETDGTTPLSMSPASYDASNKLTKPVVVSYTEGGKTETINWEVTIINDIQGITVVSTDHKTSYNVNDPLDTNKLQISVTRAVGTPSIIDVTDDMVGGFDSSEETTGLPLTITYEENGITQTTTYNITVADSVTGISIKTPPKDKYKYNEELDLSGAKITVTSGKGTKDIDITKDMITGYDKEVLGNQTVTVTYGGKTAEFIVNVKDYVTGITVIPDEVSGEVGNELVKLINDNTITYTVNYAKAGAGSPKALTTDMVSGGYDKMKKGTQNLTVNYTDTDANSFTNGTPFSVPFTVDLANKVSSITITAPSKDKYNHGQSIDKQGATVSITYADTTTSNGDLNKLKFYEADGQTPLDMSPTSFDSTNKLTKPVVIKYTEGDKTETINWEVTIINDIQGIAVVSTDHKTSYNVNEPLDTDKLQISVTRAVGTPSIVDVTEDMVGNFDSTEETTSLPLTITYTENEITQETTYNITVADSVTGISIKTPPKDKYKYNEELDLTGAKITVTSGKGTKDIDITQDMISGYNKERLGDQEVTVTYGGETAKFIVNVKDYVTGITITPSTVNGEIGNELTKLITDYNITYTVNYAKAGAKTPEALIPSMVVGYDKDSKAIQNLKVQYTDTDEQSFTEGEIIKGDLSILLVNEVADVTITIPTKDRYKHGEALSTAGGEITLTYSDGTTSSVPISTSIIKEIDGSAVDMRPSTYDNTQKVNKTLKIEYTAPNGKKYDIPYPITIVNEITGIRMKGYPKQNYKIGDTENLAGGTIEVTRLNGEKETINLTDNNVEVTGFDTSSEKTVTINVTYEENGITKDTSYNINVSDEILRIEFETTPKSDYRYGDKLDHTGAIKVTKASGTITVPITKDMITEMDGSPFDSTQIGPRKLKVTYMGQTLTYDIDVKDYIKSIKVNGPDKDIYNIGEELDLTGAEVIEIMASGIEKPAVPVTEDMISDFDSSTAGTKTITVTHEGLTDTFKVTVQDTTNDVQLVSYPDKTEYKYGEQLDLSRREN